MMMVVQRLAKAALSTPAPLLGAPPTNDRGARLDPQTHRMLAILEAMGGRGFDELGPVRARREMVTQSRLASVPPLPVHRIDERRAETPEADLPVRIYTPRSRGPLPATVYFHGGGFVIGDLDSHDAICRHLAVRSGSVVVSIDYRLAPEHPFPCAADDAWAAFRWAVGQASSLGIDPSRVAVAGDSAGGNLAAVVAQLARNEGGPSPAFQLLIYPAVDLTRSFDSHRTFASGFFLTEPVMDWFLANYLSDPAHTRDPKGSPIMTRDLSGLPPAHVVTAGFDPLRDEGEAYADALRAAGVPTTSRCYDSLIHGFVSMGGIVDAARHALDDLGDVLHRALWP